MINSVPLLVAHRGYPRRYPENTMAGFIAALQAGACFVEFDIQLSADAVPVVIHDQDLYRTGGHDVNILTNNFADLREYCVAETDRFSDRFLDARLSTLDDIVDLFTQWPRAQAIVEIKRSSLRHFGRDAVLKSVHTALQSLADRSIVISFDFDIISEIKALGTYRTGWIIDAYTQQYNTRAKTLKPDFLIINDSKLPETEKSLWPGSWQWMVYTIDDAQHALQLAELGAGLIETNNIGEMLQHPVLKQRACNHE